MGTTPKNKSIDAMRRFSLTPLGRGLAAVGRGKMAKIKGKSKENLKAEEEKERAALKEYYKLGGDKILKRKVKDPIAKGEKIVNELLKTLSASGPLEENPSKKPPKNAMVDGYNSEFNRPIKKNPSTKYSR